MKRSLLTAALLLLLILCVAAAAQAAEIRPLETANDEIDLANGYFCLGIRDADKVIEGGYFTAALYLEDRYDAKQIESMAPGDTVLVNGRSWTVREVEPHLGDEPGPNDIYEIYTEEENDGYIIFIRADDSSYLCTINDWIPVSPVGDVRVMLPLPDKFGYLCGDEEGPLNMDAFLNDLEEFGDTFVPYNTYCAFQDGMLMQVAHNPYPMGPEEAPDEDVDAVEEEAAENASDAVPVWKFCHGVNEGLESAVIRGYQSDCEEGPIEYEITPEEIDEIRDIAINGVITGKANDMSVTGGTWIYSFETPEGTHLLSIEMYKGLIVAVDGMYSFSR